MSKHRSDTYFVFVEHEGDSHLTSFRAMYSRFPVLDDAYFGCLLEPETELILDCGFHEFPHLLRQRFEELLARLGTLSVYVPSAGRQTDLAYRRSCDPSFNTRNS